MPTLDHQLPITDILPEILEGLDHHLQLVLQAPPGAGKTTLVPLAILQQQQSRPEGWLQQQRILLLEPRRMAARSVAKRMASLLDEPIGQTIGYRVRQDSKVSRHTRIEVITEGVLLRMLLDDPSLQSIGLIIFDEFHERSIDMDTGLALALQCSELFRDQGNALRLLVMSATLDGEAICTLLGSAPLLSSQGRSFPVTTHYGQPYRADDLLVQRVCRTTLEVLHRHPGSVLVFLPGQAEIRRVASQLKQSFNDSAASDTLILPLYGALPYEQQQRAIEPLSSHPANDAGYTRKVVLATDIAETSLTIEGITVVIDCGLRRVARFDNATAMTRLTTRRISKDASEQRKGRAGRMAAGHCYRLWSEEQQHRLAQHSSAEILQADLAPLVLQLLAWGIDDIHELHWLDTPPAGSLAQALELLAQLGAVVRHHATTTLATATDSHLLGNWQLTPHGQQMTTMPAHPRLAHMLLCSIPYQLQNSASLLAALLTERSPAAFNCGGDLAEQLRGLSGEHTLPAAARHWSKSLRQQANRFQRGLAATVTGTSARAEQGIAPMDSTAFLLACAYPDRLARRKPASHHHYQLSNGRLATLQADNPLCQYEWLAVAELGGGLQQQGPGQSDRIYAAAGFSADLLDQHLQALVNSKPHYQWDEQADRFVAEQHLMLGKLTLARKPLASIPAEAKNQALLALLRKKGLSLLPWKSSDRQWQARVMLLQQLQAAKPGNSEPAWPDVSEQQLLASLEQWLLPYLDKVVKLGDFKRLNMTEILGTLLPWSLSQQLNSLAPAAIKVPSGSSIKIDYLATPPVLKVKLQEMFGCQTTPAIANGELPLMLHLLSPAQRPLQITQDLAGFWKSSYFAVQKDMKGRYPKHPWPDDPLLAAPSKYSKRRQSPC